MLHIGTDQAHTYGEVASFIGPTDIVGEKNVSTQLFPGGIKMSALPAWERCWFVGWPRKKRRIPMLWFRFFAFYNHYIYKTLQTRIQNLCTNEDKKYPTILLGEGFHTQSLHSASTRLQHPEHQMADYFAVTELHLSRLVERTGTHSPSFDLHVPAWLLPLKIIKHFLPGTTLPSGGIFACECIYLYTLTDGKAKE